MIRKTVLAGTVGVVAAGAVLVAAGAAEAKTGATLTVKPHAVAAGHTATFTVNESSDSQSGANHLVVSLQERVGHRWATVTHTAKPTHSGGAWGVYTLGYKAAGTGAHTFRAVAAYHGKTWGAPSNTVRLTVRKATPNPRHTLHLSTQYSAVRNGRLDTFTVGARTTAGQATGLKVCLQRALPKGPGWETLKCVTVPAAHGKATATYQIAQKLTYKGARYEFRAVASSHGKAWAAPSNTVSVAVK